MVRGRPGDHAGRHCRCCLRRLLPSLLLPALGGPRPVLRAAEAVPGRALTLLMVVSGAVLVYFMVRTVTMRRKNRKTRRYRILDTNIENVEFTPLKQDDEDDDSTLFDANHPRR
ncbi:Membrane protein FAM174A [Heterocephalus glaber]|uniref:Transmembrane protein 157 n=1 Tax=Heterocephalus glaber TaxID=10181 RepID=G5ARJ9_HETGA|nr:Membrane protein FAM174A [Heterocephalus glaber]